MEPGLDIPDYRTLAIPINRLCPKWFGTHPHEEVSLSMPSSLFQGAYIGYFVELAIDFEPTILVSAFLGIRREYLYLGGLLSSGVSILF
ncbi:hypothetical protein M8C21_008628 [Ambrosia artemisiifolia]|uniref:Uncharacterized protein n=1 Tax=Ambrosia artemisiifolia TaxID=4212 RepID=A0AAD5G279_AMBAR|nr:hypothetical protein M8C21_008628 [Ambrosia artemisiifolia]